MRHLSHERDVAVDPHAAEVEPPVIGYAHRAAVVPRPDAGGETVRDAVGPPDRLVLVAEALDCDYEIIISTMPKSTSRWLQRDLPKQDEESGASGHRGHSEAPSEHVLEPRQPHSLGYRRARAVLGSSGFHARRRGAVRQPRSAQPDLSASRCSVCSARLIGVRGAWGARQPRRGDRRGGRRRRPKVHRQGGSRSAALPCNGVRAGRAERGSAVGR